MLFRLSTQGIRIRSIWIADTANQSASGMLNEEYLGNDCELVLYPSPIETVPVD
jgi:hypothetical protein